LIELVVVVALLAIISAIGIPAYGEMVENNRIVGETNELVSVLSMARIEAVRRHGPVTVCPDGASFSSGVQVKLGSGCSGTPLTIHKFSHLDSMTVSVANLTFLSTGLAQTEAQFTTKLNDKQRVLCVRQAGRLESNACSGS
jgi:Tfp pilus assembly protein FimT